LAFCKAFVNAALREALKSRLEVIERLRGVERLGTECLPIFGINLISFTETKLTLLEVDLFGILYYII